MSRLTLPIFLLIIVGAVVGWLHFGSSGTFVSHGQNFTALLKIDRLPNNQIVGLYQQIILRPDGQISNDTALVSGVSQLAQMTLNLKQQPFSMNGIVMANFNGINLTLTSVSFHGLPSVQVFSHSSIAEFDQYAAQLQHKANAIAAERQHVELEQKAIKQKNEFIGEINSLILQMNKTSPELDNRPDAKVGCYC